MLSSLVAANCLIVIPEERKDLRAGDEVEIELL
jgi:molybdopterin biosynthesis enzyme